MKYENVKFGKDCREKLIEGVNLTADAVEVTFGPEGRNSIIAIGPDVKITKDGYHTAMMIGWFSISLFILLLLSLIIAGFIFNYLNERNNNIYSSWMVHMFANFAINTIGFILFGILQYIF